MKKTDIEKYSQTAKENIYTALEQDRGIRLSLDEARIVAEAYDYFCHTTDVIKYLLQKNLYTEIAADDLDNIIEEYIRQRVDYGCDMTEALIYAMNQ